MRSGHTLVGQLVASGEIPPAPFIVGATRSGTTLLRLMLDAHPDMAIPSETHFIPDLIKAYRLESATQRLQRQQSEQFAKVANTKAKAAALLRRQQAAEGGQRIWHDTAVLSRMHTVAQRPNLHGALGQSAKRGGEGWLPDGPVAGVGDHEYVGGEFLAVLLEQLCKVS